MKYGYSRVSTAVQQKDGNSLEHQEAQLKAAGAEEIVSDTFTGTKMDRPEFSKLIAKLEDGDTLIVTKLDRFARTATDGANLVRELVTRGVAVEILNMGKADNNPMGKLMVTIMLAFSEYERDMIVERTQAGKAVARAKGVRVDGRPPKYSQAHLDHAMTLLEDGNSYTQVEKLTGISKSTLIRQKRKQVL
jgi:DNA invertase Pin-like site-specific DNA recombinase